MDLKDEEITEFQTAWNEDFGEYISFDRARYELRRLLTFLDLVYEAFYGQDRRDGVEPPGCGSMAE